MNRIRWNSLLSCNFSFFVHCGCYIIGSFAIIQICINLLKPSVESKSFLNQTLPNEHITFKARNIDIIIKYKLQLSGVYDDTIIYCEKSWKLV